MHKVKFKIIILVLVLAVFQSDIQAEEPEETFEEMPGLQNIMTIDDIPSDDEQLGVETGSMGLVPADGGLSLLLAAGAAYGARRLRRRK